MATKSRALIIFTCGGPLVGASAALLGLEGSADTLLSTDAMHSVFTLLIMFLLLVPWSFVSGIVPALLAGLMFSAIQPRLGVHGIVGLASYALTGAALGGVAALLVPGFFGRHAQLPVTLFFFKTGAIAGLACALLLLLWPGSGSNYSFKPNPLRGSA